MSTTIPLLAPASENSKMSNSLESKRGSSKEERRRFNSQDESYRLHRRSPLRSRDWGREKTYRGREGDVYHHRRDRHRNCDADREGQHRHRSHRQSRDRSNHRSRSHSLSRPKRKRVSGFDVQPSSTVKAGETITGLVYLLQAMIYKDDPVTGATTLGTRVSQNMPPLTVQATRHARRIYVGCLSPTANEQLVASFFSQAMSIIGGNTAGPGDAVINVYINHQKKFAFLEFRSVQEASNAMALDGIIFQGAPVKMRRPSDYNPSVAAALGPGQPDPNLNLAAIGLARGCNSGLEGPERIFVGGIPYYMTEEKLREFLESFGPLQGFHLVKDRATGNSKGYAFCVYKDISVADMACSMLDGLKLGQKTLTVRRAVEGVGQPRPDHEAVLPQMHIELQKLLVQLAFPPTKILCLLQAVTGDELRIAETYDEILEDMSVEGEKYGELVNVVIPRPGPDGESYPGVGKVFLEYADTEGSTKAREGMNGRKFDGNRVVAIFYPENKFAQGDYDG